jgi:glycosyltransferase involved in cell wall biosynthesis
MLDGDDLISVYRTKLGLAKEKILKASDATANISPAIQERSLEAGFRKSECFLVPNGVDTEAFNPPEEREKLLLRRKLNISKFSKVLLSVGSVRERKRTKDIIDVFSSLSPDYPETALVLVGPHPERSYLNHIKGLIRKQNLEEKVIFTGRSDHVSDWMKACDIFIFASDQEGLPNVLLEAMSTGMPVVSRSIKGITDFIIEDGRNGILANNNEKMVQEISHILGDGKMRNNMSKMARQRIVNDFSVDKVVGNYLEVFNFISKSKIR